MHASAKHPTSTPAQCFTALVGWDPNAPAGPVQAAAAAANKPKPKKKKDEGLDDLLAAGLNIGKKKKK